MTTNHVLKHYWIRTFVRTGHDFAMAGETIVSTTSGPTEAVELVEWLLWRNQSPPPAPCSHITMAAPADLRDPAGVHPSLQ